MIRHYLTIAWRNIIKSPLYSTINILGLSIGMACTIAIFLYIHDEITYDGNHTNPNIYRLNCTYYLPNDGGKEENATMGAAVAQYMVSDYEEILQSVRLRRYGNQVVQREDLQLSYETIHFADSNIFELFTFPLLEGDPGTALNEPYEMVLSQEYAKKYFNTLDVVGKQLYLPEDSLAYTITGVLADVPANTHLKFDMLGSFQTLYEREQFIESWWSFSTWTYLELQDKVDPDVVASKIKRISANYIAEQEEGSGYYQEYFLQHLSDIHLTSDLRGELEPNSKKAYVLIFGAVGLFILIIAAINFMNLSTARSSKRAREIAVRKVSGAYKQQLIGQFLSESILMSVMALIIATAVVALLLNNINTFTGKSLSIFGQSSLLIAGTTLFLGLFTGLISGAYPALYLSSLKPTESLKGKGSASSQGGRLRKVLVVLQFTISIVLIGGTFATNQQLTFMREKSLGFEKERTIYIPTRYTNTARADFETLKRQLESVSSVRGASLSSRVPGTNMGNNVVRLGWSDDAEWSDMRFITVDHDFVDLYQLTILAGRSFDKDRPSDVEEAFMINESGAARLGWTNVEDAIGKELRWQQRRGRVIGVLKDFHFRSVNQTIEPFIVVMNGNRTPGYISVRLATENLETGLKEVEAAFSSVMPNRTFEYSFLDVDFDQQYQAEEKFMQLFTTFSAIAIFIACLGLYGLAMFIAQFRFKEIGVRKVLGASTGQMVLMLNKEFSLLVLAALVIAVPVGFYASQEWIATFPYKANISVLLFIGAGLLSLLIAWLTVSMQSYKAAAANPVKSIRAD